MDELGNILGVWAHPDDEAYLTAGIMARAVRNGSRVVCVTATGSQDLQPDTLYCYDAKIGDPGSDA